MKDPGHESRVLDAYAKSQRPHPRQIIGAALQFLEHKLGLQIVGRQQICQTLRVVPAAATPGDLAQIEAIVNAVVDKWRQALLIDGVPQAKLRGNTPVEPIQDRQPVAPFRGRGEPEEFDRLHVLE